MPVLVRLAEDRDIPAMAAIRAQEWETVAFWESRIKHYLSGEHTPQGALRPRAAFVAVHDDKLLGFVSGHRTNRYGCDAELQWVNVMAEERARGIAGELMVAISAWFVQQDALRVCVNVKPENVPARGFYARYGAKTLNKFWMVWEDARIIGARPEGEK